MAGGAVRLYPLEDEGEWKGDRLAVLWVLPEDLERRRLTAPHARVHRVRRLKGALGKHIGEGVDLAVERGGFAMRARVVPEDGRPQRLVAVVEQRRAVHLSREPNAAHRCERARVGRTQGLDRALRGRDPAARALLAPTGLRPRDLERRRARADERLPVVYQHGFDARRAEVDAEIHASPPPTSAAREARRRTGRCRRRSRRTAGRRART